MDHFEYYSGDYDDKSLMLKEMSEACKNNKLDEFLNENRAKIWTIDTFNEQFEKKLGKPDEPPF